MLKDIVFVEPQDGYKLRLRFEDGCEGIVDVSQLVSFEGVFAPLKDRSVFEKVRLNAELGSVEWEDGADLDPIVLYSIITGTPVPDYMGGAQVK